MRVAAGEPFLKAPNRIAIPETKIRGPPMRPSIAMPRGTRPDLYIK